MRINKQTINELQARIEMLEEENARMQTALLLALVEPKKKKTTKKKD